MSNKGAFFDSFNVRATGTYKVFITPSGVATGSLFRCYMRLKRGRGEAVVREKPSFVGPHPGGLKATPAVRALAHRLDVDCAIVTLFDDRNQRLGSRCLNAGIN